jgi:hypothetical protein
MVLINESVPKVDLATANGVAQTGASLARALGPFAITSIYSLGAETELLDGWLVYAVLLSLALLASVWSHQLEDGRPQAPLPVASEDGMQR